MSQLQETIAAAKAEGRAALVAYLPVGYPDVDASIEAMVAAVEGGADAGGVGGADIVEVGVPYSDPGMDGPVIQQAVDPGPGLDTDQQPTEGAVSNDEAVAGQDAGETA